jgi:class 3 adenylate cyclase
MDNARVTLTDQPRLVTVHFADLVGFAGRSESAHPEAACELQHAFIARARA